MTGPVAGPVPGFAPQLPVPFTPGHVIHIGPHDVFRYDPSGPPHHVEAAEADVYVDDVIPVDHLAVIMWHAGTVRGATVYDYNDQVRCVA